MKLYGKCFFSHFIHMTISHPPIHPFIIWASFEMPSGHLNIKTSSYMHRHSHYKDKTVLQPSYPCDMDTHTCVTWSLYWNGVLVTWWKRITTLTVQLTCMRYDGKVGCFVPFLYITSPGYQQVYMVYQIDCQGVVRLNAVCAVSW